ncbi:MAG: hypothetical protein AABY22_06340 [Nanoarchaeota archaeon]
MNKEKLWKIVDKLIYLKMAWNQGYGNLSLFINIAQFSITGGIFIKVFEIENYFLVGLLGIGAVCFIIFLGHVVLSRGVIQREMTLQNKYNPQITKILEEVTKK